MATGTEHVGGRGRSAERPRDIPGRGWRDVALRVKAEAAGDRVTFISAAVAFYLFLAVFPGLAALVSIYGLFADPSAIGGTLTQLPLPAEVQELMRQQLQRIASSSDSALGIGLAVSLLVALWSASKGMKALIEAMNIAYDEEEERGFLRLNALALGLTLGALAFGLVALGLIVGVPALIGSLAIGPWLRWLLIGLSWVLLGALFVAGIAVLYRYAPSRDRPQWRWTTPGAIVAVVLWLAGSVAFSVYVASFGSYNETYGSLAAVVLLLMWFYLSAVAVVLGAEVDAEAERQTRRDTTQGAPRPMGSRDAYAADTLGPTP